MRDPRLDFYRGIAMFIILIAHTPNNFFNDWIPARWGFSDATEIFVFCSGMASAIAFGRTFDRRGWGLGMMRVVYRVWQVYWTHICMFFIIAMIMAALDRYGDFDTAYIGTLNLWKFFSDTEQQLVGLFTLTYVPNYFDILPMYLAILAMIPVVMALSQIGRWAVAMGVVLVWLLAQERLLGALGLGGLALDLPAEPWSERVWFFNPFGWQLIFFTGFAFMRGWLPAPPVSRWLIAVAALIVVANLPLSDVAIRELGFGWAGIWRSENIGWIFKTDFGILRYLQFLALAYLGWVAAGIDGRRLKVSAEGLAARIWGGTVTVIMKVGQQSLAAFVFSMVFARINGFALDQIGRTGFTVTIANLVGFGLLVAVAYGVSFIKGQPWRSSGTG